MNSYQKEQLDALLMIREGLSSLAPSGIASLEKEMAAYLDYRQAVTDFWEAHFYDICTEKCFQNGLSACCSKDGIITFFADVVINALVSEEAALDRLEAAIRRPERPDKCVFLNASGCLWKIKPIVCELFLCDSVKEKVFEDDFEVGETWARLREEKKRYTWPDQPVLFEFLEAFFRDKGYRSPLMYIHCSPGLMRIRRQRPEEARKSPHR
ncbi:MAG: hypothetical protein R6U29_07480 [Desulfosudaceae bacterium]